MIGSASGRYPSMSESLWCGRRWHRHCGFHIAHAASRLTRSFDTLWHGVCLLSAAASCLGSLVRSCRLVAFVLVTDVATKQADCQGTPP